MPYRVNYHDAIDVNRLVAVTESLVDARQVIDAVTVEVPPAAGRLAAVEDPVLGLDLRVIQPPQTLETAHGLPVVYLGGTVDPRDNWQATATAALRPHPAIIINSRRERPTREGQDAEASVRWRRDHLFFADVALYWFSDGDPDPIAMLELGLVVDRRVRLAVGASPRCTRRAALAAHLRYVDTADLHDTFADTVAAASRLVEDRPAGQLAMSRMLSEPAAVAWTLRHAIESARHPDLPDRLDEIAGEAGRAGGVGFEPSLLTRIYVAVDRLRLDGSDPLGWAQLHDAAIALSARHRSD
ncbi:nucleoside 2-deoxyribosyltransferase domain-containing protein [Plantactinospora solaniradicis]|uniref:Nucleoside 2-deoxyribosyltransferase domain-containing protein n=1 Tax=Plantactinospora solaniradicis TaxID=1723736 RepID=A0ABW1KQ66_9ACTN